MSAKKRIVIVGPAYPLRGGNALFVGHLYDSLSELYDVNVISFSRLYPGILFPGVRQTDISSVVMKKTPARQILDSINPLTWYIAAKEIVKLAPDLVVIIWWNPFFGLLVRTLVKAIQRKINVKILLIVENVISHEARWVDSFLTKLAVRTTNLFMVLSQIVENDLRKLVPEGTMFKSSLPIYDCYRIGPELTTMQARKNLGIGSRNVILFFGYIRKYKGLMDLLNAFPRVKQALPDTTLLIVGEFYDDRDQYDKALRQLNIHENVHIVAEYVPNEDVYKYYDAADVVVLPYREATQSGILNIAYGFDKPVIVTDVGGLAELVEDGKTGFIVPANNPAVLADKIIRFYQSGLYETLRANVSRKRKEFSFYKIQQLFEEIIAHSHK